jgi:hypothetical protein
MLQLKLVLILQSNWESTFQPGFTFNETKISNEEVIAPGTVIISAGGIVPILEK